MVNLYNLYLFNTIFYAFRELENDRAPLHYYRLVNNLLYI